MNEKVGKEKFKRLQLLLLEKRKREDVSALKNYNKGRDVHKKQLNFHKCASPSRWVFGGNRSGKTECGAVESIWIARGNHPFLPNRKNAEGWVVSLSSQVQRDVAQRKILHYLNPNWIDDVVMMSGKKERYEHGVIDFLSIRNVNGGVSKIGFRNCEQGREKFQGVSLDFVWFDEEPEQDVFEECRMRLLDKKGVLFSTMTPLKGLSWVYDSIFVPSHADESIKCFFMEWADNPFLPKDEVARLSESLSSDQLESRRYGRFASRGGMVYPEFDQDVHVIEPFPIPIEWQDKLSIDPGLNNPLSCHWYAVNGEGDVFVVAEHYEAGRDVGFHSQKIKEICNQLNWHTDSKGRIHALIDSAATCRTLAASKSVCELFVENGILVNPKVNKDIFSGIQRVKGFLQATLSAHQSAIDETDLKNHESVQGVPRSFAKSRPKLYVFSHCKNLIREFKGYFWGSGDVPKQKDDHALDELRYYLNSRPEASASLLKKTLIQKDKELLIKKRGASRQFRL